MSELRARPLDLCMSDAMPFNQHWEYRSTWPVEAMINDEFFLPVRSMLRAGDLINVCRFDKADEKTKRLMEVATVRVISAGQNAQKIPLLRVSETHSVPEEKKAPEPEPSASYTAKKVFGGGFIVEDDKGNAVDRFKTKADAEAFAADLNGEKVAA